MLFNENIRVKIPAILHLVRLGYEYISLSDHKWDISTNIFTDIFAKSIKQINRKHNLDKDEISRIYKELSLILDYEDLGEAFYKKITTQSGIKLIDFENFNNNFFHVVTELTYKNGNDEFRPDITLLINGMPLVFIEVKKPSNRKGILEEHTRINKRFQNDKFNKFLNISQLLIFSNNMEYDQESIEPIQGAYYATTSKSNVVLNYFREEESYYSFALSDVEDEIENFVLKDNNHITSKYNIEFQTNKNPISPTNRILTSLCSKDRLAFVLEYGIAYVDNINGVEKHIMRYPQLFATKAIESTLNQKLNKGIVWHTQGSGKTALAYFNVKYLTSYFQKKGIIPKFYFIVDRLDLMNQASTEFSNRGLVVNTVDSKKDFIGDIKKQGAIHNLSGKREITVVNIHKFGEESTAEITTDYNLNIQRIYFIDEVHRSYSLEGLFLANLVNSDRNAIIIGLTGTPLISGDITSKQLFGNYIHKYYYNASIADGYTLRLIREGIDTNYQMQLKTILEQIEVREGDVDKTLIYAHRSFVHPMLDYIVKDFGKSKRAFDDDTIGAMVVCDSNRQAKMMYSIFVSLHGKGVSTLPMYTTSIAAEPKVKYGNKKELVGALILHDIDTKEERKQHSDNFKEGKIDILFVNKMLLTGFDAKRLKKLYLGRVVKDHNLLQTLTRVNRPYKNFKFGYVVDFADIRNEFDKTNKAYFDELQEQLGDELQLYSDLFLSPEDIEKEIEEIQSTLFDYDLQNAEIFSQQVSEIKDRKILIEIRKSLESVKNLHNLIRLFGYQNLLDKIDFHKLKQLYYVATSHLELVNHKEALNNKIDPSNLLNIALEDIVFLFKKVSEEELVLADKLKDILRRTRESMLSNIDPKDPEFVSLRAELERLFKKSNLDEVSQEEMKANMNGLNQIYDAITDLNRRNNLLKAKYKNDAKYARLHKRMLETNKGSLDKQDLYTTLMAVKGDVEEKILNNSKLLDTESYFSKQVAQLVLNQFSKKYDLDLQSVNELNDLIVREYINEYNGINIW